MEEMMLNIMDGGEGEDALHIGWRRGCSPQRMEERMLNTIDGGEDAHHRGWR